MELANKKVLITGGTRGIGRALAEALVEKGAEVFICGRSREHVEEACAALGVRGLVCDLATAEGVQRLAQTVRSELSGLDVLINNAGVQVNRDLCEGLAEEDVQREIYLNFTAPMLLTDRLLSLLMSSQAATIVNLTSALSLVPTPRSPVYCASKAALSSYTKSLRASLEESRVRVLEVVPPVVKTDMTSGRNAGALEPRVMALCVTSALERNRSRLVVGKARLLDWLARCFPALAFRIVRRF